MASHVQEHKPNAAPDTSPLAFVFNGNEMIVQCTANGGDQAAAVNLLGPALQNFKNFNDGKHAAIVRRKNTTQYWITSFHYAQTLDTNAYDVIKTTAEPAVNVPVVTKPVKHHKVTKVHIRRPRNQFIIYRQWMSGLIHADYPGVTAACISPIIAQLWHAEKPEVKAHFKALADEEDRQHKMLYPGYRYVAGRRNPQLPPSKRNLPNDPMTVAERLIAAGF